MASRLLVKTVRWFEVLAVVLLVGATYLPSLAQVGFHGDESQWIASSRYWELLLSGEYRSRPWPVRYSTLTQPPVVRYTIGMSRSLAGLGLSELNKPYRFKLSLERNRQEGRVPSPELLYWSRLPMALQTTVAFGMLFTLVGWAAGRLAGYLTVGLLLTNPFFAVHLRRAMGEASLLFWSLLTTLITAWILRRIRSGRRVGWPAIVLGSAAAGLTAGLAGASKLNGLAAIGIGATIALVILLVPGRRRWQAAASLGAVVLVCLGTFVVVNPFLHPHPVRRARLMFENRLREMKGQLRRTEPAERLAGSERRVLNVADRVLYTHAPFRFPLSKPLTGALTLIGMLWLAWQLRLLARPLPGGEAALALLAAALALVPPALLTPLAWGRYFLFPVLFSSLFMAVALQFGIAWLLVARQQGLSRSPSS